MTHATPTLEQPDLLFVTAEEKEMRLDQLLTSRFPSWSRSYFQNLIEEGSVLINGELAKKRIRPEEGDEIEVYFQAIPEMSLAPESIPLDILYEDAHLIAINKPPGMVVHPAPGHWSHTFVNALLAHCGNIPPSDDPIRPGIVHRLDKDTSGVLIAAKTRVAHQKLIEAFSQRRMGKLYLAICRGRPANQTVSVPIGRHPTRRKEMAVIPDGKSALSEIQTLAFNDTHSLVLVKPKTGRTHQIRVHLKHVGSPVVGDPIYGSDKDLSSSRLLLHAYRLDFTHPISGEPIHLKAPIPDDLKVWINRFSEFQSLAMSGNSGLY